jgi:hypothetical protein
MCRQVGRFEWLCVESCALGYYDLAVLGTPTMEFFFVSFTLHKAMA